MVERNVLRRLIGTSDDEPFARFLAQTLNAFPAAVHKEHVAVVDFLVADVIEDIMAVALDGQHVQTKTLVEVGLAQRTVDEGRFRRDEHLCQTDFIEIQFTFTLALFVFKDGQMIIGRHFFHIIGMSEYIDGVARRENGFRRDGLLRDRTEDGTVFAAHLQHRHAVAVSQIEFLHGAALYGRRPVGGLQAEDTVVDMIFMEQSRKRFAIIGLSAVAALFAEEDAAERPKEQRAHDEENKADGGEIEES